MLGCYSKKKQSGLERLLSEGVGKYAICIRVGTMCNLSCSYCLSSSSVNGIWAPEHAMEVYDKIIDASPRRLIITGGEPFLYPSIKRLCLNAFKKGIYVKIGTNAQLSFDRFYWVASMAPLLKIDISCHSLYSKEEASPVTGRRHFDKIFFLMDFMLREGVDMSVNIPLIKADVSEYMCTVDLLLEKGARFVKLTRIFDIGNGRRPEEVFLNKKSEFELIDLLCEKYPNHLQPPLNSFDYFNDGTLLIDENLNVRAGSKMFDELSGDELNVFSRLNGELYSDTGYQVS